MSDENKNKRILLGVTGSIAAYKAPSIVSGLKKHGHDVRVVITRAGTQFITPMTLATISGNPVSMDMWEETHGYITHIEAARWADIFVVAPATANIIGKFANGIADDICSTMALALGHSTLKIIYPAMNTQMLDNAIVQDNIKKLQQYNWKIGETQEGMLACGDTGKGMLLNTRQIVQEINAWTFNPETEDWIINVT